ncbi:AMP-binding enzyme domain-containing protein [Phthorimaea operculella]|nr:AMP-binding enzyme domain-containing protein [Phthorimaea operculella]
MKFAAHKTQAVIITKKRKYEEPIFNLQGTPIKGTDSIKFLGLTIDRNLSFRAHLANANKKAINIYKRLAKTIRTTWGLNPEITRMLYLAVIEPIVLYGAGAWASVAEKQYAKKILNSLTRTFCLKICRAHRTTSLISSALIARVLPLDLRLMEQGRLYEIKRGKPLQELPGRKLEVSFAVQRGEPTAAQRYLDLQLQSAAAATARPVTLPDLIYYCMKANPTETCLINGVSGVTLTNWQVLQRAVPLARALVTRQMSGQVLLLIMRSTEQLIAIYYGAIFAGVKLFLLDPMTTKSELDHFLPLAEPSMIVCDEDRLDDVKTAVHTYGKIADDGVLTTNSLGQFASGHDSDPTKYFPVEVSPKTDVVLLPTSGSTGLPKIAKLTSEGLVAQLPSVWGDCTNFPRPTKCVLCSSSAQWTTFSVLLNTCSVFGITFIFTSDRTTSKIINIIETYKVTWLLLGPFAGTQISEVARPEQLSSVECITLGGEAPAESTLQRLATLMPKALLVDDNEDVVQPGERGELYLKGISIIKGYMKNEQAQRQSIDGWFKTGDIFTEDKDQNLFFIERKTFWFRCINLTTIISPQEFESVIKAVDGVLECVVGRTDGGAAAAVVRRPGSNVTRESIYRAIENSDIHPHKRLRGGIAFVARLPHTHSGKLHRSDCNRLITSLFQSSQCA